MINLFKYDEAKTTRKSQTKIVTNRKSIVSRDINYRPYYIILKKFHPETNHTNYFICMLDEPDSVRKCSKTLRDDYGRVKLYLDGLYNEIVSNVTIKNNYIEVDLEETSDNADIYLLV